MKIIVMNKLIYFLLIIVSTILFSCNTNVKKIDKFYPNKKAFSNGIKLVKLDFEDLTYEEISKLLDKKNNQDSMAYIEFEEEGFINKIIVCHTHPEARGRNLLSLSNDSIFIDNGYNINHLEKLMLRHYLNNGINTKYPLNHKTAFIEIKLAPNSKELKSILSKVVTQFNEINKKNSDSLELNITIYRNLRKPPPPPN
jgi:hypothetical protein